MLRSKKLRLLGKDDRMTASKMAGGILYVLVVEHLGGKALA